jgi:hypothetical protein
VVAITVIVMLRFFMNIHQVNFILYRSLLHGIVLSVSLRIKIKLP